MSKIFCSYKWEDQLWKYMLEKWAVSGRLGDVVITGESEDVRPGGYVAVNPMVMEANKVIVLVGYDTHNSTGVEDEIHTANSHQKDVIPVRVPGTTGGLPSSIKYQYEVVFEPNAIKKALGK